MILFFPPLPISVAVYFLGSGLFIDIHFIPNEFSLVPIAASCFCPTPGKRIQSVLAMKLSPIMATPKNINSQSFDSVFTRHWSLRMLTETKTEAFSNISVRR